MLNVLPAAPVIETFHVSAIDWGSYDQLLADPIISTVAAYWNRAPYTKLGISLRKRGAIYDSESVLSPLRRIPNLTEFAFATMAWASTIENLESLATAWPGLRKLRLTFLQPFLSSGPQLRFRLADILSLAARLPQLEELSATADPREKENPEFLEPEIAGNDAETALHMPSTDLSRFQNLSLKSFDLYSSFIPKSATFVANVIKQVMPNLEVAILKIGDGRESEGGQEWQDAMKSIGFHLETDKFIRD
jgi:hypothetical protein